MNRLNGWLVLAPLLAVSVLTEGIAEVGAAESVTLDNLAASETNRADEPLAETC